MTIDDPQIGRLEFRNGWRRLDRLLFSGQLSTVIVRFEGEADEPIQKVQREAFDEFWRNKEVLISLAEKAILAYYLDIRPDVRERLGAIDADSIVPEISNASEIVRVTQITEVFFPECFGDCHRVFGLLADCTWDPGHGIAIKFENEEIVEIGEQGIML